MDVDVLRELRKIIIEEYDVPVALEKAEKIKHSHIPKRLFKFRAVNKYALENFKGDTLFCAKADSFNDPFDCSLTFQFPAQKEVLLKALAKCGLDTKSHRESIIQADDPFQKIAEWAAEISGVMSRQEVDGYRLKIEELFVGPVEELNRQQRKSCNICSLCERLDSLPMWAHYGDDHKGFVMEYDFSTLPIDNPVARSLWPVMYEDALYDVSSHIFGRKVEQINPLFLTGGALRKCLDWQYEKEWRIVVPVGSQQPAGSVHVPTPVALYLGASISDGSAQELIEVARTKNIPVFRMRRSQKEFKMEPVPLKP
jgi:hypothetical protein